VNHRTVVIASRRSAHGIRAPAASERDKLKNPAAGIERLLQAFAVLQEALPFEQQLAHVLDTAREGVGLDGLVVWAAAPEGDRLLHVAGSGVSEEDRLSLGERMEIPLTMAGAMAKVYRGKIPLVVDKAHPLPPKLRLKQPYSNIKALRTKSFVVVPIIACGRALGLLVGDNKYRRMPLPVHRFHLLPFFALHLATTVEKAQLLTEREAHKRELTESLEQQTATSEILRVISQSQRDVQPVFEAIAANARKLCEGTRAAVYTYDGELIKYAAGDTPSSGVLEAIQQTFPIPPGRGGATARAILTRAVAYVPDVSEDPEYELQKLAQSIGFRSALAVPMLREGSPMGVITVTGAEPAMFTDHQIAMLQTFADQAVIAIENARLFNEVQERTAELGRSVEELKALGEVGSALSSTLDVDTVLTTILTRANQLAGTQAGQIFDYDEASQELSPRAAFGYTEDIAEALRRNPIKKGEGVNGRAIALQQPVQIPDIAVEGAYDARLRSLIMQGGFRALLAVPLIREDQVLGTLAIARTQPGEFPQSVVDLMTTFASQSALAMQNASLFHQLQVASKHKSQFLANMSHELRTPLNAILGYTELIVDQIYGEVPEKIGEVLDRVQKSGRHLLGLINDVLDLSKIEAGQLTLNAGDYAFSDVVQTVFSSVGSLAAEKRLRLTADVAPDLPVARGDERRITQVLLNLVGNAIKFTEKGEVAVRVRACDGALLVTVADTGPGIKKEDQEKIFEEFQQSDAAVSKSKSGTGLGLAIAKRIVELHGGRIWVESVLDQGSTFFVSLPIRAQRREVAA
jgi:signal transduction histidine kinase